ncbi:MULTISPECIES: ATP-binding cassette domain-containing protein [Bacillaceae]|uniref:Glycosyl transferase family 8 n=1 Tax=Gottfriedia luciferensis TaxID=178774 RepID=A0ABX2ZR14_9BACI|nr:MULTISPECIES: ATP-binding cassette domain-containing protein [Bacillaceae]ODG92191.1 glycosyl transferase family 8 [Gottfriedia luciferensis]SFC67484.1 ABC-2 type transport system ATP-binding protein [Bacillus sp. UNCCL81]
MSNTAISVKGLEKSYKNVPVLKGVEFEVKKGSVFALLGSNGAGKTTIIKILTTLLQADKGEIEVCNANLQTNPQQVREKISLTGQNVAVDDILTGRENLDLVAKLRHLPNRKEAVEESLRRFDLVEAGNRALATYSGGMKRRLDLAMTVLGSPELVFLDEPSVGLDPEARLALWEVIRDMAKAGITVFLTTQYLEEAEQLADRIAILHEGKILIQGTLNELKAILPPKKVEYVEKQPNLEEIFLAVTGKKGES